MHWQIPRSDPPAAARGLPGRRIMGTASAGAVSALLRGAWRSRPTMQLGCCGCRCSVPGINLFSTAYPPPSPIPARRRKCSSGWMAARRARGAAALAKQAALEKKISQGRPPDRAGRRAHPQASRPAIGRSAHLARGRLGPRLHVVPAASGVGLKAARRVQTSRPKGDRPGSARAQTSQVRCIDRGWSQGRARLCLLRSEAREKREHWPPEGLWTGAQLSMI
jgi:hypothetical protein